MGQKGWWTLGSRPASEHQEILAILAALIRADRFEIALRLISEEICNQNP